MVKKFNLLFLAGLVWSIVGYNVLHIGCQAYVGHISAFLIALSILVFAFFQFMVFGPLVKKHTKRITSYEMEKQWFWHFFDKKSFIIMAVMMSGGIIIRMEHLWPDWLIAFFYVGLGFALLLAGLTFFEKFIKFKLTK